MNKQLPTAIVAKSFQYAYEWFKHKFEDDIKEYHATHRMFVLRDGSKFVIVTEEQQANNLEFCTYILSPDYRTLLDIVKQRIR